MDEYLTTSNKKYAVRFSAHGSDFFPKIEHLKYNLTIDEAERIALEWELRADTVGGKSEIIQYPSIIKIRELNGYGKVIA